MAAEIGRFEIEEERQFPEIRPVPFVKLGRERVSSIERDHDDNSRNEDNVEPSAGRRFLTTLPKPRLVSSWFKFCVSIHVFILHAAAFAAGFAKKGKVLEEEDKQMWVNIFVFLMVMSTTLGMANGIDEPKVKDRAWNWLKFLTVAVLAGINITFGIISYAKEGDNVTPAEIKDYANKQVILIVISFFITMVSPQFVLVKRESELDDDLEKGKESADQLKKDLADYETTIKTLSCIMERLRCTQDQVNIENEMLMSWINRAD